jgi:glycosyltransferase involved in cell wall biosynthesis
MIFLMNLSIIIPHKDRPELLAKLLKSIPERDDLEIIIVDDNSNEKIVDFDKFPGLDRKNVKIVFDKKGGGGGYARNIGLDLVEGKWVLFADSDDYFTEDFKNLLENGLDYEEDVVFFKAMSEDLQSGIPSSRTMGLNYYINKAIKAHDYSHLRYQVAYPVAKLISSKIIKNNKLKFEEIPNGNDVFFP